MYTILLRLATQYGSKLLLGAVALAVLSVTYLHWRNGIYDTGYNAAAAKWEKREASIVRQQEQLLKLKEHENALKEQRNHEQYTGALKYYVEKNQARERAIAADYDKRLFVSTKRAKDCRNSLSAATEIPGANTGIRESADGAELERETVTALYSTIAEVDKLASVCKQAFDFLENNGLVE